MSARGNVARAESLVDALITHGVTTWCVAPGGRNAPLVAALDAAHGLDVVRHFEERSAAFFALGRARRDATTVAVVTTSGTAAAELLPAAIEARYSGTPLVLVTADRPRRLRGTGAPQAIEQPDLFAPWAPTIVDADTDATIALPSLDPHGPVHVNIAFDEPLLDTTPRGVDAATIDAVRDASRAPTLDGLTALLADARRPFLAIGGLLPCDVAPVRAFARRLGAPLHADATSQLRTDPALAMLRLSGGEASIRDALRDADAIVRIGAVPIGRFWRDLERDTRPVASIARAPYPGVAHGTVDRVDRFDALAHVDVPTPQRPFDGLLAADRARTDAISALLDAHPRSEPALVRALSRIADGFVFLGNSSPVREWCAFADRERSPARVDASRGANGIDGQLSTFLGGVQRDEPAWAVVGDLTALYDLAAPWVLDAIAPERLRIAILNNGGGRIFDRVFGDASLSNAHCRRFDTWAAMWGLDAVRWDTIPSRDDLPSRAVVEIVPDRAETEAFWRAHDEVAG